MQRSELDSIILQCPLFKGMREAEMRSFLSIAGARLLSYAPKGVMLRQGARTRDASILLAGAAEAEHIDHNGRRFLVARVMPGGVFGDALSASGARRSPVSVVATARSRVLRVGFEQLMRDVRIMRNLITVFADKYFDLHDRVNCLIKPTLRDKVLYYLARLRVDKDEPFDIPLDRAGLADYLYADRSALSRELSRMKQDGLIDYHKNSFRLYV
jgi:CRP-like cAMP-binding protein